MPATEAPSKTYTCAVCGESFNSAQALGGHSTKHAHPDRPKTSAEVIQYAKNAQLNAQAAELMGAAEAALADVDGRISDIASVLDALKAERADIVQMMRRVHPVYHAAKVRKAGAASIARKTQNDAAKRELVVQALTEGDGAMTGEQIAEHIRDRDWQPRPSPDKVRKMLREMHDTGMIRAVNKVRGGGFAYALVTRNGGAADGT